MLSPEERDAAIRAGILSAEQADRLDSFLKSRPASTATFASDQGTHSPDDEHVRFARGFHDVFLTVGVVILLFGAGIAGPLLGGNGLPLVAGPVIGAVLAWALAEFFVARQKLVLPGIVLALGFTAFAAAAAGLADGVSWSVLWAPATRTGALPAAITGLVASCLFYARFRLPFAVLTIAAATVGTLLAVIAQWAPDAIWRWHALIILGCGIVTFVIAMAFDLSDPARVTLRSDRAFWLHLFASPLIVQSVISLIVPDDRMDFTPAEGVTVIALVIVLAVVAVTIDRRALLVAALSYLGFAIASLMHGANVSAGGISAVTLLLLGALVVGLGAGWQPIRAFLLRGLPWPHSLLNRLPPVGVSS
ncbi:hypothetical protein SAMN05216548_105105 [Faunimonas pinastri]|uniref:DUF2157 domain-containing protein n=1 Tax=Faunimonas pinastri TaxID=1855383 RepID=A0A1H9GPE4_9HYPH|nr:hypothetical protein [Faunimonas pinastri]SEQ51884.1 hypothetical protein SAMN05216548_105105 [Faunimonas pinastri]